MSEREIFHQRSTGVISCRLPASLSTASFLQPSVSFHVSRHAASVQARSTCNSRLLVIDNQNATGAFERPSGGSKAHRSEYLLRPFPHLRAFAELPQGSNRRSSHPISDTSRGHRRCRTYGQSGRTRHLQQHSSGVLAGA